jgi:hypothetical protein
MAVPTGAAVMLVANSTVAKPLIRPDGLTQLSPGDCVFNSQLAKITHGWDGSLWKTVNITTGAHVIVAASENDPDVNIRGDGLTSVEVGDMRYDVDTSKISKVFTGSSWASVNSGSATSQILIVPTTASPDPLSRLSGSLVAGDLLWDKQLARLT